MDKDTLIGRYSFWIKPTNKLRLIGAICPSLNHARYEVLLIHWELSEGRDLNLHLYLHYRGWPHEVLEDTG